MRIRKIVIAGAAGLVLAGTGTALASVPDSGGTIHGCYYLKGGALAVIDTAAPGQSCGKGQAALDWNQAGPQGPAGAGGAQGPAGPPGPSGVSGYQVETCDLGSNVPHPATCQDTSQPGGHPGGTLYCPAGKVALSASWDASSQGPAGIPVAMVPVADQAGSGYNFAFTLNGGHVIVYVTCIAASP